MILNKTAMLLTAAFVALTLDAVAQEGALRISQADAIKAAKQRPQPDYPAMAKQLHLEGEVQVEAHISESGTVEDAKPLTGNALLATAAVNAMRRWRFSPFMADGKPRKAVTELSFSFKL